MYIYYISDGKNIQYFFEYLLKKFPALLKRQHTKEEIKLLNDLIVEYDKE